MGVLKKLFVFGAVAGVVLAGLAVTGTTISAVAGTDAAQDLNHTVREALGLPVAGGPGSGSTPRTAGPGRTPPPTATPTRTGTPFPEHLTPTPVPEEFRDAPDVDVGLDAAWDRDQDPDDPMRSTHTTSEETVDSLAVEYYIHAEVNERRERHGLAPLNASWYISSVSRAHSQDMAAREFFSHRNPDGEAPSDRFGKFPEHCADGYGENIALNYVGTPVDAHDGERRTYETEREVAVAIVDGWMNSTGHRENILRERFDHVGTGVFVQDLPGKGTVYATQNFCGVAG